MSHQREQDRIAARCTSDRVLDADILGEFFLKLSDLRAHDKPLIFDHASDDRFEFVAEPVVLSLEIEERDIDFGSDFGHEQSFRDALVFDLLSDSMTDQSQ